MINQSVSESTDALRNTVQQQMDDMRGRVEQLIDELRAYRENAATKSHRPALPASVARGRPCYLGMTRLAW